MAFTPILDLYIDVDQPGGRACLLQGLTGSAASTAPAFINGDVFLLRLHFRRRAGGIAASTNIQLDTGFGLAFAAKASAAGTTLFSATSFTEDDTDVDDIFYEAELALTATALATALSGQTSITVICDIEVQADSNAQRLTYQFSATVRPQIYANELPPVTPGSALEIIGGAAYLDAFYLKVGSQYHLVSGALIDGVATLTIEQTGVSKP